LNGDAAAALKTIDAMATQGFDLVHTAKDLLAQIQAAPVIKCDQVAWQMMGLSMASWNMLFSLALMALWLMAVQKR
jgi:disulfide bond formation protein DsbB